MEELESNSGVPPPSSGLFLCLPVCTSPTVRLTLSTWVLHNSVPSWKVPQGCLQGPHLRGYSPARGMQFQVLLPARGQHIVLEVGIYDEVPAVGRLGLLHLLIEDFLPLTSGQACTHGPAGRDGSLNSA